jgi:hypothetical protein
MTKTKSRIFAALALSTALTAPALIVPMFTAPAAIAGEATPHDFSDLAAKVTPAVVNVQVTMKAAAGEDEEMQMSDRPGQKQLEEFMRQFAERFGQQGGRQQRAQPKAQAVGTGFIVDPSGIIVTNYHVAGKADSITVTLSDGRKLPAKLLGGDEKTDLAVLKVSSDKPLPSVQFGDAAKVRVGQPVMAVGNPFGLGDDRHRVGARPRHPVGPVRRLHPDRRGDQPRQLRWPAVRHGRQGDRHQHRDLLADRRFDRAWLRHPGEHCRAGGRPAQGSRPGPARLAGRPDPAGVGRDRQ